MLCQIHSDTSLTKNPLDWEIGQKGRTCLVNYVCGFSSILFPFVWVGAVP